MKITMKKSKTVAEYFEEFIISKRASGLSEKSLKNYSSHFKCISKHLEVNVQMEELKKSNFEEIEMTEGDIFKIRPDGIIERDTFKYTYAYGREWWEYGTYSSISFGDEKSGYTRNDYLEDLKSIARFQGYSPEMVDGLVDDGFSLEEIEEYMYYGAEI